MSCEMALTVLAASVRCANKHIALSTCKSGFLQLPYAQYTHVLLNLSTVQVQAVPAAIPRQDNLELTELTAITPLDGSD